MKVTEDESPTALPSGSLVPLEAILCTEELHRRPTRPPDYQAENRALGALVQALADSPPWGKTMVLIALTGWGQRRPPPVAGRRVRCPPGQAGGLRRPDGTACYSTLGAGRLASSQGAEADRGHLHEARAGTCRVDTKLLFYWE
jgi:hypothetical protein